jgi:hypothetical protein
MRCALILSGVAGILWAVPVGAEPHNWMSANPNYRDDNERDWTANELHAEAEEILDRASAFKTFLQNHGLMPTKDYQGLYE